MDEEAEETSALHWQSRNPYISKYGEQWEVFIRNSQALCDVVSIRHVVTHIFTESPAYVYHDALSLMTSASTRAWMKTQGGDHRLGSFYDRWILPKNGLNKGTNWASSPVGNSPEMMPLDCTLFKDLIDSLNRHVAMTRHADDNDRRKFSRRTPSEQIRALKRLWNPALPAGEGAPSSARIVHDIEKVVRSMKQIREAGGNAIGGCQRSGWRVICTGQWGGYREKGKGEAESYVDPGARELWDEYRQTSRENFGE